MCHIRLISGIFAEVMALQADRVINMGNDSAYFTEIMLHRLSQAAYLGFNITLYANACMAVYTFDWQSIHSTFS
jgi:hypothetical protein